MWTYDPPWGDFESRRVSEMLEIAACIGGRRS